MDRLARLLPQIDSPSGAVAGREALEILLAHRRSVWAEGLARRLTERFPEDSDLWRLRASAAAAAGLGDEALASARRYDLLASLDSRGLRHLGLLELENGSVPVAIQHLESAVRMDAGNSAGWLALARALEADGRDGDAIEALEGCLEHDAEHDVCSTESARLLARVGRVQEAREALRRIESRRDLSAPEVFLLGNLLVRGGDQVEGEKYLQSYRIAANQERNFREENRRYQSRLEGALVLVLEGSELEALQEIDSLREIRSRDDRLDILEAEALVAQGRVSAGLESAQRARRARPRMWRYHYLVASHLARLGLTDAALAATRPAIRLQPLALPVHTLRRALLEESAGEELERASRAVRTLESVARPEELGQGRFLSGTAREFFWVELILLHPASRVDGVSASLE